MKEKLEAAKTKVDAFLDWFAVILFMIVFVVVLLQVFMRYVFNAPIAWSEELARYLFMWLCFIGWCFATRNGTHIRIAIVADNLPNSWRKALDILNFILTMIFAVVLLIYGSVMMEKNFGVQSITLFFSYAVVYASVPFGMAFLIFYNIYRIVNGYGVTGGNPS
jgi:TRAP-type C4-dicarboxylate transport system permease small subunit